jgi:8-oxo-dGTP pyrophosphatase MutT (NUDIX family)
VLVFKVIEKRGGGWHPVTGGVDPGESYVEGAARELQEETGIIPEKGRMIDLNHSYSFTGRWGEATEHAFGVIVDGPVKPKLDPKEHLAAEWVTIEEASKRVGFESQRDALVKFSCYLR